MGSFALTIMLASVPFGAALGGFLWLDAKSAKWSSRPLVLFTVAGAVVVPMLAAGLMQYFGGFQSHVAAIR